MSFLALAISVCTPLYCSAYSIDTFDSDSVGRHDCDTQLDIEYKGFRDAWDGVKGQSLQVWLEDHKIFEDAKDITSAGFECVKFEEPEQEEQPKLMYAVEGF